MISRVIAFVREWLLLQFLSVGDTSDIFFTAFRIPNTLRKIFAEGALSSILVPAFISAEHKEPGKGLQRLTTLSFLVIEAIILLFCIVIFYHAPWMIAKIAPGFCPEKIAQTAYFLRILISFILFISSGVIFASALQSQRKFFIPAIAPSILNIVYVGSLVACLSLNLSITTFCYCMIMTSVIFFLLQLVAYLKEANGFLSPTAQTRQEMNLVVLQLIPCIISVGISEINHFINTGFASYLPSGSMTLLRSSFQFVNIPIGIITASLVTVLLPHFSKLHLEQPKELSTHLFEAFKFIIWTTSAICFLLFLCSQHIFETLFMGNAEALVKIPLAQSIFIAYLAGLLCFSLNKVLLSIFYALRQTMIPMIVSAIAIGINYHLNGQLIAHQGAAGIALASSIAAASQTILLTLYLSNFLHIDWQIKKWTQFIVAYLLQLGVCSGLLYLAYVAMYELIAQLSFSKKILFLTITQDWFLHGIGVWLWVGPLCLIYLAALYLSRGRFGIYLSYFDEK